MCTEVGQTAAVAAVLNSCLCHMHTRELLWVKHEFNTLLKMCPRQFCSTVDIMVACQFLVEIYFAVGKGASK